MSCNLLTRRQKYLNINLAGIGDPAHREPTVMVGVKKKVKEKEVRAAQEMHEMGALAWIGVAARVISCESG
jgi:hypothetical protein